MNKNGFLSFRCPLFYRFRHKKKPALAKGGLFFYSKNQLQTVARPLGCVWYFAKPVARPLGCMCVFAKPVARPLGCVFF